MSSNREIGTIITQTPFRISFFGGGTDFPAFFNEHGGSVLGATINKYLYVSLNSLERLVEKRIRISYSKLEVVDTPEELQHELAREVLIKHKALLNNGFVDINTFADLPYSSGMGSSSAFTVGFLNAFYMLHNIYRSPGEIAREAIEVEREILKNAGGWQDQIHVAYGGFNRIDFSDNDFQVTPIALNRIQLNYLESNCLLFFTGLIRQSADIQEKLFTRNEKIKDSAATLSEEKIELLQRMNLMVDEGMNILTRSETKEELLEAFGRKLHEAWICKKSLSDSVTNDEMEAIYNTAISSGAYGGKLLGAGGGGFFLFIAPPEKHQDLCSALSKLKRMEFKFGYDGTKPIFVN